VVSVTGRTVRVWEGKKFLHYRNDSHVSKKNDVGATSREFDSDELGCVVGYPPKKQ
jgi:hypothetical protein